MPGAADLPARLGVVLAVIYAIFNEGYTSAAGEDWARPELCHDALRLGRRVMALQPGGCVHLAHYRPQELPGGHRHVGHDHVIRIRPEPEAGQASDPADAEDA